MTGTTKIAQREHRFLWGWVLFCCLLSLTASFNISVLAGFLDGNCPAGVADALLYEGDESHDDDEMLRPAGRSPGRRGEPELPCLGLGPVQALAIPGHRLPPVCCHPLETASRARCEHAHRNGLGAPLLC